jgi:hypothetical protein
MRYALALCLFLAAGYCQFRMIAVFNKIRREVNNRQPADKQYSLLTPSWNRGRFLELHKRYYPTSRLPKQIYPLWSGMMVLFLGALGTLLAFK